MLCHGAGPGKTQSPFISSVIIFNDYYYLNMTQRNVPDRQSLMEILMRSDWEFIMALQKRTIAKIPRRTKASIKYLCSIDFVLD